MIKFTSYWYREKFCRAHSTIFGGQCYVYYDLLNSGYVGYKSALNR